MSGTGGGSTAGQSASGTSENAFVPTSLTSLIPTFDPATDQVEIWAQKVELLSKVWPADKISELITRLILNCKGSAFQKLQIRQKDLLKNDLACVKLLVEVVGGQFGQVPLEKRYEAAERALFRCSQRSDESNDSYLARTDVAWAELLSQDPPMAMSDLQAYVILRGSLLSSDDKKRVLIEAGAESGGNLTTKKVNAAIRMLGAGFFQDYTGTKKTRLKTYDQTAFHTEDLGDADETAYTMDEDFDDDLIETLVQEGDEDAILVSEYEGAINDTIQDDHELAVALNAYSDARRRLSERFRNRGFWPIKPSKGKGKNFSKGKGKFGGGRKSLQDRILSSRCRICNKLGHWKAECPERAKSSTSNASSAPTASISMTEGSMNDSHDPSWTPEDALNLEFLNLPETLLETPLDDSQLQVDVVSFLSVGETLKGIRSRSREMVGTSNSKLVSLPRSEGQSSLEPAVLTANSAVVMFASHGSFGVVDLGASKTVIGSNHLSELMNSFDQKIQDQLQRCPCKMQFRFGNQGILSSTQALVVPIGPLKVKIAIVPGNTPFLISNAFLRGLQAVVDTHQKHLKSPLLKEAIPLVLSPRGLFLMDLNEVIRAVRAPSPGAVIETICHVDQEKMKHQADRVLSMPVSVKESNQDNRSSTSEEKSHKVSQVVPSQPSSSFREESNVRSSAQRSSVRFSANVDPFVESHVACKPIAEDSRGEEARTAKHRPLHDGRAGGHGDRLWQHAQRSNIPAYVGDGARVGAVVCSTLQQVQQIESQVGLQVHRDEGRTVRDLEPQGPGVPNQSRSDVRECSAGELQPTAQEQDDGSQSQEPSSGQLCASDRYGGAGRARDASGMGTAATPRWPDCDDNPSRCSEFAGSNGRNGEHASTSVGPSAAEGSRDHIREAVKGTEDLMTPWNALLAAGDFDDVECLTNVGHSQQSPDRQKFVAALFKIDKEYQQICNQNHQSGRRIGKPMHVFEVFCSNQSRITQQVSSMGGRAQRYCREHTDLMTPEGRAVLFQDLWDHEPMHVWFSPECGPWSAWSNLNQSKSLQGWLDVQSKRWDNLEQLALGVVLMRHQRAKGNHFHWEQPSRSYMFQTPILQEVYSKTVAAEFDMCNLGNLCDPESGKPMKKGMVVLTTSINMQSVLHGHRCKGDHEHQSLEGSTMFQGRRINRTAFSENYPRKFARKVAMFILKPSVRGEKPWSWEKHEALASETTGPHVKRRRISVPQSARSRSVREDTPEFEEESQKTKRVRILHKGKGLDTNMDWRRLIDQITPDLPRVGKQEIHQSEVRSIRSKH